MFGGIKTKRKLNLKKISILRAKISQAKKVIKFVVVAGSERIIK